MRSLVLVALFALPVVAGVDHHHVRPVKRQSPSSSSALPASSTSSIPSTSSAPSASSTSSVSSSASTSHVTSLLGTTIPPLSEITSGMPSATTLPVTATYPPGAKPPISGAPPLPTPFVFDRSQWPAQDQVAPTTGSEVAQWMTELNGHDIPNIPPTHDGTCAGDPTAFAQAASRGWWTCGGYTRPTDITACPDKLTWGVSFDDGPGFYSQQLLNFLTSHNLKSTFFVVGSRVVERPQVLIEEYMSGNEIAVHTWSHRPLTSLTNEQIVAELGYTRKAIKLVLGVTPTIMRPPYGDIDDRVRAICLAMGMVPVIWTRTPSGATFDTNDWKVPGGTVTGLQSFATFQTILTNATTLDTGFIVLEHDLYEQTVDLATGYTLDEALKSDPKLTLIPIGHCNGIPATNLYRESNENKTFPYPNTTTGSGSSAQSSGVALGATVSLSVAVASLLALAASLL